MLGNIDESIVFVGSEKQLEMKLSAVHDQLACDADIFFILKITCTERRWYIRDVVVLVVAAHAFN